MCAGSINMPFTPSSYVFFLYKYTKTHTFVFIYYYYLNTTIHFTFFSFVFTFCHVEYICHIADFSSWPRPTMTNHITHWAKINNIFIHSLIILLTSGRSASLFQFFSIYGQIILHFCLSFILQKWIIFIIFKLDFVTNCNRLLFCLKKKML